MWELSASSIPEWLSCHFHACSEDLALAAAVAGTPRWWPMAGWPHGITLRREERVDRAEKTQGFLPLLPKARGRGAGVSYPAFLSPSLSGLCQVRLSVRSELEAVPPPAMS